MALEVEAANDAVPLEELEAAVRRRVLLRRRAADTVQLRTTTVDAVEQELTKELHGGAITEEVIEVMAGKVATTLDETDQTDDLTDDLEPEVRVFIVNPASDVWHTARPTDPEVTVCGWRWRESGGAPVCGVPGLERRRCMRICAGRSGD